MRVWVLVFGLVLGPATAAAQERLDWVLPAGWSIASAEGKAGQRVVYQAVPFGQSLQQWRELITVIVERRDTAQNPQAMAAELAVRFVQGCKDQKGNAPTSREEGVLFRRTAGFAVCLGPPDQDGVRIKAVEVMAYMILQGREIQVMLQHAWHNDTISDDYPFQSPQSFERWTTATSLSRLCDPGWGVPCRNPPWPDP